MYLIQIKHTQIKIPLCSFWTVQFHDSQKYALLYSCSEWRSEYVDKRTSEPVDIES